MALTDLYQLRSQAEESTRLIFAAVPIAAITRANAPQNFQQATPRVEIKCSIGQTNGHRFIGPDGIARYDRWRFTLSIQCVTRPSNDGQSMLHEELLGLVRNICSTLAQTTWTDLVNWPNLRIAEPLRDSGDNNTLKASEGIEYSVVSFSGTLCIRETAWATALAAA